MSTAVRWSFVGKAAVNIMREEYEEAVEWIKELREQFEPLAAATTYVYQGEMCRRLGEMEEAERLLREAVGAKPGRVAAWMNLAILCKAKGNEGEARDKLEFLSRGPELWGQFKTPSLRNVALTAPYMHQGQMSSLRDVLHFYSTLEGAAPAGHHQETTLVPLGLSEAEQTDLEAFLTSLTDAPLDPALLVPPPD